MGRNIDWQDMAGKINDGDAGKTPVNTYTIANLPTNAVLGQRAFVSNGAAAPTFLGALGTPATTKAPVFYNGTAWVYG